MAKFARLLFSREEENNVGIIFNKDQRRGKSP